MNKKLAKYLSIIVDLTSDVENVYFVLHEGHSGTLSEVSTNYKSAEETLCESVLKVLEEVKITNTNCRYIVI